jgi:PPK2 family polyphosphate:nucleotide phosphotransferase
MKDLSKALQVEPGSRIKLAKFDPAHTFGYGKEDAVALLEKNLHRLSALQYQLYAEAKRGVLVVLQGIDAGGKDGAIRDVMTGLNPQGVRVTSFKVPEGSEKRHDFLWRIHRALPEFGQIGVFNRSHYEDVLVVRVHNLVPKPMWKKHYGQINDFERMLSENGTVIVKFLLYIDKEEQAKRFHERIDDHSKNWKFSPADVKERACWDEYIEAFQDMLYRCSTAHAPWHVIPANKKWFRNLAISQILRDRLERMNLKLPEPNGDLSTIHFD